MQYLIWSTERNMWWKARELGYTEDILKAGRYSREQALDITVDANIGHKTPQEYAVLAPECNYLIRR